MEQETGSAMGGFKREDGRGTDQLRPPGIQLGPLDRADGSARFLQGQTNVLAAVYGPGAPRFSRKEKIEGATIEVLCRPHRGQSTSADKEKELFVRSILEEAIRLSQYPRTGIQVIIQVFEDDGGALAAAINAASLAVLNAGIEMSFVPLAVPLAVVPFSEGEEPTAGSSSVVLLDPTQAEEKAARATSVLTWSSVDAGALISSSTLGPMKAEELLRCMELGSGGSQALLALFRHAVEEHSSRTAKR